MTIDSVIKILESKGYYRNAPQPLHIADTDIKFEFDAILVGPYTEDAIILVLDAQKLPITAVHHKLRALSIVLDRTESRRPLTLVLITDKPNDPDISSLEEFARLILLSPNQPPEESLRILLPLDLPKPLAAAQSTEEELQLELGDYLNDPQIRDLVKSARKSSSDVEETMRKIVDEAADLKYLYEEDI